jgi:hypothetical protein
VYRLKCGDADFQSSRVVCFLVGSYRELHRRSSNFKPTRH